MGLDLTTKVNKIITCLAGMANGFWMVSKREKKLTLNSVHYLQLQAAGCPLEKYLHSQMINVLKDLCPYFNDFFP